MTKQNNSPNKKSLFIELNEFNHELLKSLSQEEGFTNILKLFSMNVVTTKSDDTYESERLEPWVQWVSVHTGTNSLTHKIRHLGDVPDLDKPQLWEKLSDAGVTTGIWGVLNGVRGKAKTCNFFLPDPWTFSERAHPESLNALLDFPRYMATNRSNLSVFKTAKLIFLFVKKLAFNFSALKEMVWILPSFFKMLFKYPRSEFVGYCPFEYFSGLLFLDNYLKSNTNFGLVFLNMIAHVQHYYWDFSIPGNRDKIVYALKFVDKFFGKVFTSLPEFTTIYVANALSQTNTNHEKPWISYRPISFEKTLRSLNINFESVNSLMSYDAIATFSSGQDCLRAKKILDGVRIMGQPLFYTENYEKSDKKLFFRSGFYDQVFSPINFESEGRKFSFQENFVALAVRTAKHIPRGTLFTNNKNVPSLIYNHEIYDFICKDFIPESTETKTIEAFS